MLAISDRLIAPSMNKMKKRPSDSQMDVTNNKIKKSANKYKCVNINETNSDNFNVTISNRFNSISEENVSPSESSQTNCVKHESIMLPEL